VGVPPGDDGSVKALVDLLTHFLLDAHGRNRPHRADGGRGAEPRRDVLEQVRLLTNLETATQKLLQIILIGQPELREVLARPELRQLAQRITGRYHLEALRKRETLAYIRHRLRVAGGTREIFTPGAQRELHRLSGGVPPHHQRHRRPRASRRVHAGLERGEWRAGAAGGLRGLREAGARAMAALARHWRLGGGRGAPRLRAVARLAGVGAAGRRDPGHRGVPDEPAHVAKPALPPREPLGTLLVKNAASNTMDAAFTTLFSLWGAQFQPGAGIACEQANASGLACVWQRGSLAQLKLINRPAILSLIDDQGVAHQVVLTSLGPDGAKL
jgi:general secretion pathway protein A